MEGKMRKKDLLRMKVDHLRGRIGGFMEKMGSPRTPKLDNVLQRAVDQLAVLKNQRRLRCAHGRTDIANLLQYGHHERALYRADYVMQEQDMLEVFDIAHSCCRLLVERSDLLKSQRFVPTDMKDAIATLMFCSSRCGGELPELQTIRSIFEERLGSDFALSAVELQDGCRVDPTMIQKLKKEQSSLESRIKVLKDVASEKGIVVDFDQVLKESLQEAPEEEASDDGSMEASSSAESAAPTTTLDRAPSPRSQDKSCHDSNSPSPSRTTLEGPSTNRKARTSGSAKTSHVGREKLGREDEDNGSRYGISMEERGNKYNADLRRQKSDSTSNVAEDDGGSERYFASSMPSAMHGFKVERDWDIYDADTEELSGKNRSDRNLDSRRRRGRGGKGDRNHDDRGFHAELRGGDKFGSSYQRMR